MPRAFDKAAAVRIKLTRQMVTEARKADPPLGEELVRIADPDPSNVAKVVAALVTATTRQSVTERVAALQVLGRAAAYAAQYGGGLPPELLDAVPAVVSATSASSEDVRIAAFDVLEGFALNAGPEVVAAVMALDYSSASTPEAIAAIHALRACGPDMAAAAIEWLARSLGRADVAELACKTLGWIGAGAGSAIEQLIDLATGPSKQLRRDAASALIAIDPAGTVVSKRISDRAQREAMLMALRETGAEGRDMVTKLSRKWAPKKASASGKRNHADDNALLLHAALLKYHGYGTDKFHQEPASQKELQALTGWTQFKVSREMEKIFGKTPMVEYRQICRRGGVRAWLEPPPAVRRKGKPVDKDD